MASSRRSATSNQVRIIGGRWRSRVVRFPAGSGVRPTPDRVRETLFNWLGQDLTDLTTLDLFAGSGVLSLEALSRGAAHAVAIDASAVALAALRRNADLLEADDLELHRFDAARFLTTDPRRFDVVFVDPPFRESWLPVLWPLLPPRLNAGARVYIEQPEAVVPPAGWAIERRRSAGSVHYHLLRFQSGDTRRSEVREAS